jgi:hypothetical protein
VLSPVEVDGFRLVVISVSVWFRVVPALDISVLPDSSVISDDLVWSDETEEDQPLEAESAAEEELSDCVSVLSDLLSVVSSIASVVDSLIVSAGSPSLPDPIIEKALTVLL